MKTPQVLNLLRIVPDFPKPGVIFRDISPLLASPADFSAVIDQMAKEVSELHFDTIVAIESRGFVFGAPLAVKLKTPLVMARKPGKLPGATESARYGLEYGTDALHIQRESLAPGASVLVVDDVLATGGTAKAAGRLIEQLGAKVAGYLFLLELSALGGRAELVNAPVNSLAAV